MKNEPNNEQDWVEQTLHSLDGATRPVPSPWLYQQVRHRLEARQAAQADTPDWGWTLKRVAFATALLAANVVTFAHRADFRQPATTQATTQEYAYPTLGGY
ncbi:hypothetical protein ACFP2F_21870 [Hymenobacter artigasi]|uniref:Uncharacterized protein n=1 Tax=Hymenobacter artigasi TaxID=2719616 RepID=A0ABX1HPD2_9BACT|nr:hypothetical protein [Hymenobacter artigasi]NKI90992.1 hypothetical protein [Hymenobacter artigasi]